MKPKTPFVSPPTQNNREVVEVAVKDPTPVANNVDGEGAAIIEVGEQEGKRTTIDVLPVGGRLAHFQAK